MFGRVGLKRVAALVGALTLAGGACGLARAASDAAPATAPVSAPPALTTVVDPSYKLGPADKLHIITYGEAELTGDFSVGGDGQVALPLIGDIQAGGLTVDAFRDKFVAALKDGYILDPRVSVEVLTYRPYYVMGEVGHPGELAYSSGLTVMKAVAAAGGFTYRANQTKVSIQHQGETKASSYPLSASLPVQPGDTITISERYF